MFAFISLLKRQFLLQFKKRVITLVISITVLYAIAIVLFLKANCYVIGPLLNQISRLYLTAPIMTFINSTTLSKDMKTKNKNIEITPINSYLINFSYFFYSFIVNFVIKLLISLAFYVAVFSMFGIFYYQTIWAVLCEAFLFSFVASVFEVFLSFFCYKFIRVVSLVSSLSSVLLSNIVLIFYPEADISPISFLAQKQIKNFFLIFGLGDLVTEFAIYEIIIFFSIMFLLLLIQNIFLYISKEKKFK